MFLAFVFCLLGGSALVAFVFSGFELFGVAALAQPRWDARISLQRRAAAGARLALQTYLWLGWAAICAWAALYFVAAPGVGNPWPYYVIALFATGVPISWLHLQNRRSLWSEDEQTDLQAGTNLWRVVLLLGVCASSSRRS